MAEWWAGVSADLSREAYAILRGALFPDFLALPAGAAARDVMQSHFREAEFVDLDDPGIVADIDDPEAYRSLVGVGQALTCGPDSSGPPAGGRQQAK